MSFNKQELRKYTERVLTAEEKSAPLLESATQLDGPQFYGVYEELEGTEEGNVFYLYSALSMDSIEEIKPIYTVFISNSEDLTAERTVEGSIKWRNSVLNKTLLGYDGLCQLNELVGLFSKEKNKYIDGTSLVKEIMRKQDGFRKEKLDSVHDMEKKQIDKELADVPECSKGFNEWVTNDILNSIAYLFYTSQESHIQGYCSSCNHEFELSEAKHNMAGHCPVCGHSAVYKNLKRGHNLLDVHYCYSFDKTKDGMVFRCFRGSVSFIMDYKNPVVSFEEQYRALIDTKGSKKWYVYDHFKNKYARRWCTLQSTYDIKAESGFLYPKNLKSVLKDSYLEGTGLELVSKKSKLNWEQILRPLDQRIIKLFKAGITKIASGSAYLHPSAYLGQESDLLHEILMVSKGTATHIKKLNITLNELFLLRRAEDYRTPLSFNDCKYILDNLNSDTISLLENATVSQIKKYVEQQKGGFAKYGTVKPSDILTCLYKYWQLLKKEDVPFNKGECFPKDLRTTSIEAFNSRDNISKLPKDIDVWVNDYVFRDTSFIFFDAANEGTVGHCSKCNKEFLLENPRANEMEACPHCEAQSILKNMNSRKKANTVKTIHLLEVCPDVGRKAIMVRTFSVQRNYDHDIASPEFYYNEIYRTYIDNGGFISRATFSNKDWRWSRNYTISSSSDLESNGDLYLGNLSVLDNTLWKYCSIDLYASRISVFSPWIYLKGYIQFPQIEYLLKLGMFSIVGEIINQNRWINGINKKATTAHDFFNISKHAFKQAVELDCDLTTMNAIQYLEKFKETVVSESIEKNIRVDKALINRARLTNEELLEITDYVYASDIGKVLKRISFKSLKKYIASIEGYSSSKNIDKTRFWLDYISMAEKVVKQYKEKNKQISDFPLFPKNLEEQHDVVRLLFESERLEEKNKAIAALRENWTKFDYIDKEKGLLLTHPKDAVEIVNEGNKLKHCVKTYIDRVAAGKTTILFVRSIEQPDKPLYTLEYRDSRIIQFYGISNSQPPSEVKDFTRNWLEQLPQEVDAECAIS